MAGLDTSNWSLKRLAWAYGCAQKGSPVEAQLLDLLMQEVSREASERIIRQAIHDTVKRMRERAGY